MSQFVRKASKTWYPCLCLILLTNQIVPLLWGSLQSGPMTVNNKSSMKVMQSALQQKTSRYWEAWYYIYGLSLLWLAVYIYDISLYDYASRFLCWLPWLLSLDTLPVSSLWCQYLFTPPCLSDPVIDPRFIDPKCSIPGYFPSSSLPWAHLAIWPYDQQGLKSFLATLTKYLSLNALHIVMWQAMRGPSEQQADADEFVQRWF